jgi:hypothetical protein
MSAQILQINFQFNVPRAAYEQAVSPLAGEFAAVPGCRWKIWLMNEAASEAGGIYLFEDEAALQSFLQSSLAAQVTSHPALSDFSVKPFEVLKAVTQITRGPVADVAQRQARLRAVAEAYFEALRQRDFAAIPYAENVNLRAPLAPGGAQHPLIGKPALHEHWWLPLAPALAGAEIKVLEYYVNDGLTAVCAAAEITLNAVTPPVTLRVADRFTLNAADEIVEQENHFDPRDVTNPGWQRG